MEGATPYLAGVIGVTLFTPGLYIRWRWLRWHPRGLRARARMFASIGIGGACTLVVWLAVHAFFGPALRSLDRGVWILVPGALLFDGMMGAVTLADRLFFARLPQTNPSASPGAA